MIFVKNSDDLSIKFHEWRIIMLTKTINLKNATILVTGATGFIGANLSRCLLDKGCEVIGIDNINDYYDVNLKHARLDTLQKYSNFHL